MKSIAYVILFSFFVISCTPVKLAKVESNLEPTLKGYVYENDSLKITYRFWNEGGRMEFDFYNKLSVPLYVDWKISAYIPNDKMVSYWRDETNTEAVTAGYYYKGLGVASSKTKAVRMERIGVIPPKSLITQDNYVLVKKYNDLPIKGDYTKSNTPLRFRNYMMIASSEKFDGEQVAIDNLFYVTTIKYSNSGKYQKEKSPFWFYITKK